MKINRPSSVNFGIIKRYIVKNSPIGDYISIVEGETSKSSIKIYKEYTCGKLDLKFYSIKDKITGKIKSRLQHICNKKIIREVNRSSS